MKDWMTAREIAEAGLPDLPTTKRGIAMLAATESWDQNPAYARKRDGKGGGFEYHFRLLPTLAQVAYAQRTLVVGGAANDESAQAVADEPEKLTDRATRERDARLAVVAQFDRFAKGAKLKQASCLQVFTDKYNFGTLSVEPWVKDLIPHIGKRTLLTWMSAKRNGQTSALAVDRSKCRKGTGVLESAHEGRLRNHILALLTQNAHYSAQHVRMMCISEFGEVIEVTSAGAVRQVPMPPVRTFQHTIKSLKATNQVALMKLQNPDQYRSAMAPAGVGTHRYLAEPNQIWQIDASPIDALCVDGRHTIYACIDVYTRRTVFLVSKTPKASAVALLLRKAILAWGVPRQIKTDNGSDFVAHDTKRLFLSLDIDMELSDAYSPQQKGFVERVIKTFQHDFGTLLPGFIGHSVTDRKAIENRKSFAARLGETEAETFGVSLTGLELQRLVDRWAESIYEVREHGGLKGKSPRQMFQASNFRKRVVDERALDLLLMPVAGKDGQRTTTKFGIRIDGYHYATPRILPGTSVFVRQDPHDMGKVYAFAQDGSGYLGEGICPELAGIHPATFMKAVRQLQAEAIDEVTRPVRKIMKQMAKGLSPIERALQLAVADAPNVIALPKRTETHTTLQIDAALSAMDEIAGNSLPVKQDDATAAEHRRLVAQFEAEEQAEAAEAFDRLDATTAAYEVERADQVVAAMGPNVAVIETPLSRYRRAVQVERSMETADPRDVLWLGQYQTTAEYRGQKTIHVDFGDSYLS